jgi:hypothetical protein
MWDLAAAFGVSPPTLDCGPAGKCAIMRGIPGCFNLTQPSEVALIGRSVALVVAVLLLGAAGYVAYYEVAYRERARGFEDDVATLRRLHWERPPLRGVAGSGNAAAEAYAALARFAPLPARLRESLAERLYYGQVANEPERAAIAQRQPALRALRNATEQGWAFTELAVERGASMRAPDYRRVIDAGLCLLADAKSAPPAECLRTAADVIRLGQDLVPGAPLEAASASTRLTSLAARIVPRCALEADLATLRRSVHEFNLLATHAPPTGAGIELQDLVTSQALRDSAALSNKDSPSLVAHTILTRPALLGTWAQLDHPARSRKLTPDHYPDSTLEWRREQEYRAKSPSPLVAANTRDVLDRLHDDMRGQAILRMLAIGVATLADKAYRGKLPARPSNLDEVELADPYRGGAFNWRIADNGSELTLWSIGEDYKDDGGSNEWSEVAPVDIVVRFALSKTAPRPQL